MWLQLVLCYCDTYNISFITSFLKSNTNYIYILNVSLLPSEKLLVHTCSPDTPVLPMHAKQWDIFGRYAWIWSCHSYCTWSVATHLILPCNWHYLLCIIYILRKAKLLSSNNIHCTLKYGSLSLVRSSKFSWGEIFCTHPDRVSSPLRLLHKGYWLFPRDKEAGGWSWPPTPLVSRLKKEKASQCGCS